MAQRAEHVTYGKPKIDGGIKVAPLGTTLPTTADGALNQAFKSLGYVSEDGLTNNSTRDTDEIRAWGGDTVLTLYTGSSDEFSFTLIESINEDVLKFVYGDDNVTGNPEAGMTVKVNAQPREMKVFVIDTVLKGGYIKRMVIPKGEVIQDGEIAYTDGDATGFPITVKCNPDEDGYTHYQYIKKGSTTPTTNTGGTGR